MLGLCIPHRSGVFPAAWAEDDFRSVNGQIEYLLTQCVRQRKKNGKYVSDQIDVPPELDLK